MGRTMRPRFSVSRGQTWWRWHYTGVRSSVLVPIAASVASLGPGLAPRGADRIPVSITAFRSAGNAPLSVSGRNSSHRRCHFFFGVFFVFQSPKKTKREKRVFSFSVAWRQEHKQEQIEEPQAHIPNDAQQKTKTGTYCYLTKMFVPRGDPPTNPGPCSIP